MRGVGEGLAKNHTILGIHFIGNKGKINAKGMLMVLYLLGFVNKEEAPDPALSQVFSRINQDLKSGVAKTTRKMKLHAFSN